MFEYPITVSVVGLGGNIGGNMSIPVKFSDFPRYHTYFEHVLMAYENPPFYWFMKTYHFIG